MNDHTTNEIPYGYCRCGCGQKTRLAPQTNTSLGWIKGEPIKYILGHCRRQATIPEDWRTSRVFAPWVSIYGLQETYGKCQCGCGNDVQIAKQSLTKRGILRGHPLRFLPQHVRVESLAEKFEKNVDRNGPNSCWIWLGANTGRYGRVRQGAMYISAHRLSYELHFGLIPEGVLVCHHCDNPRCVNPNHLFLGSPLDNMRDKIAKGRDRYSIGENNPSAKLRAEQVIEIRRRAKLGESGSALARNFNVDSSTIREIIQYKIWRHVP